MQQFFQDHKGYLLPYGVNIEEDGKGPSKNESSPKRSSYRLLLLALLGGADVGSGGGPLFSRFLWFLTSTELVKISACKKYITTTNMQL